MTRTDSCPRCGAQVSSTDANCSSCLLALAFSSGAPPQPAPPNVSESEVGSFVPPSQEEIAKALPGFDNFAMLGRGGMGSVFRAREIALDRTVAIKVLPRSLGARTDFRERFLREARALARLNHPNVVNVFGAGEAEGLCYLVMEFVDGPNLRDVLRERRVEAVEALRIVRALCDALQYTHDEGVVHRDIKPENVLIDRTGKVKLADFGLAKLVGVERDSQLTRSDQVMGTPHYMAPEQMERPHEVDHRADLFALGVILYELLTGSLPRGTFELPSKRVSVDVRIDDIVLKALEREPARRYQHALEVKGDVENLERPPSAASSPREPLSTQPRVAQRKFWIQVAIVALFAAYWTALAWSWNHGLATLIGAGALLTTVTGAATRLAVRESRELRAAIHTRSRVDWIARASGFVLALAVGLVVVVSSHVAKWESGGANWSPLHRDSGALLEAWKRDPWGLVRFCGIDPSELQEPRVMLAAGALGEFHDSLGDYATLWAALGALLCIALAIRAVVDPSDRAQRPAAWNVSMEIASLAVGALLLLWIAGSLMARPTSRTMTSVAHSFTVRAEPREVARRLSQAFADLDYDLSVDMRANLDDGRTGRSFATVRLLRAQSQSLFQTWRTSWDGAHRSTPQLWITIGGRPDDEFTHAQFDAGIYRDATPEADAARALLREFEARLSRE